MGGVAAQIFTEIDAALFAEGGDLLAGGCIEGVDKALDGREDAPIASGSPIDQAAVGTPAQDSRVEPPEQLSGGGIQSDDLMFWSDAVEDAVDDKGLSLGSAGSIGGVVGPGHFQAIHIGAIDLRQGGVAYARGTSAVGGPVARASGILSASRHEKRDCGGCGQYPGFDLHRELPRRFSFSEKQVQGEVYLTRRRGARGGRRGETKWKIKT